MTIFQASGVPREELFITTKVWPTSFGYDSTKEAFSKSCDKLQTDYIGKMLYNSPVNKKRVSRDHNCIFISFIKVLCVSNSTSLGSLQDTDEAAGEVKGHQLISSSECDNKDIS